MTKQMIKMALMLVLAINLTASAVTAQGLNDGVGFAPANVYSGVETSQGICETIVGMCYGNTFVLNSSGEWETRHLIVSLNYFGIRNPDERGSGVMGGSWSLLVFNERGYAGTLYGEVSGGTITFVENADGVTINKKVRLNLRSTGGLGMFKGKDGENISGAYDASTYLRSGETRANVDFTF